MRTRMRFRGCSAARAVVVLFSVLSASSALAAGTDADELIRQGVDLRRNGNDAAALQRFQQAFEIGKSPRAMAQIGLAEQALGRWVMAYEHLHQALESASDPWIKKSRKPIEAALSHVNDHVGQVEILGGSPDAAVRIDGVARGKLPLAHPVAVPTGTVSIDLVAPGFVPVQRTTIVHARETVRESFDALVPLAARDKSYEATAPPKVEAAPSMGGPAPDAATVPAPTASPPPVVAPAREEGNAQDQAGRGADSSSTSSSFRGKAKWVAWGVGAASLGVGLFGMVRQNQAGNDFSTGCGVDPNQNVVVLTGSSKTLSGCQDLKSQVDSNYRVEVIGFVGAGVLAATGLVLWLTEPASTQAHTSALSCSPGLTAARGPWLGCGLTF